MNTSFVDYVAILETLAAVTNQAYQRSVEFGFVGIEDVIIREYRTIGFKVGRQCGKTQAMGRWIEKAPDASLCIFNRAAIRDLVFTNWKRYLNIPSTVPVLLPVKIRQYLSAEPGRFQKDHPGIGKIKYILIDDADMFLNFHGIRLHHFNKWVYDTFGPDVLVIHFN